MTQGTYCISPSHYNDIPDYIMTGDKTILEYGPATGINQLSSRHHDFFLHNNREGRYLGIELEPYEERYLNIIQGDIIDHIPEQKYDLILALHVLEHINIEQWSHVISRLKLYLNPDGHLLIGTPHKEPKNDHGEHLVFNITPELFRRYLPDAECHKIRARYHFNTDGARFSFALLRFIKRYITRHPYVHMFGRLLVIWQKEGEE